jgi:hypothetical protein
VDHGAGQFRVTTTGSSASGRSLDVDHRGPGCGRMPDGLGGSLRPVGPRVPRVSGPDPDRRLHCRGEDGIFPPTAPVTIDE